MPIAPFIVSGVVIAATTVRAVGLAADPEPFAAGPGAVMAVSFLVFGLIATTGLLVSRGPWARVLSIVVVATSLGLGAVIPLDAGAWAALATAGIAVTATTGPWLSRRWLRRLPPADGPPALAVGLVLALVGAPFVVAVARPSGLAAADWALVALTPSFGWLVSRASPVGLWLTRLALPIASATAGLLAGLPGGVVVAATGLALTAVAWTPTIARSVTPLTPERVPRVPIPPEMVASGLLESAGFDDRGRPLERPCGE